MGGSLVHMLILPALRNTPGACFLHRSRHFHGEQSTGCKHPQGINLGTGERREVRRVARAPSTVTTCMPSTL